MHAPLLSTITSPADLRGLSEEELQQLTRELRTAIINIVSQGEGHLGASLGVVELTVALHTIFSAPKDILIWDVGHQAYGHKILTGRLSDFDQLRQWGGISGFPKREESPYDAFGTGHSSTSLSALLGMALAAERQRIDRHHIAVIGDASIASGMAFEALNHLGTTQANVLIVLNDNTMGIDPSVGALKQFFEQATTQNPRHDTFFQSLNIGYSGPVDGHSLEAVLCALAEAKKMKGPQLLHVRTTKGKGLQEAEAKQIIYHAPGKFDPLTGKLNPMPKDGKTNYKQLVGASLQELFGTHDHLMAITPAMPTGSGLVGLMEEFPDRCLDVGIAEQHAITLAAGMSTQGLLPFCVIYSTFLQRALDQLMHDVVLQHLPVVFLADRSGLVGHDGPTHHGLFDLSFLLSLPQLTVLMPYNAKQLRLQLGQLSAKRPKGPVVIRYPRGSTTEQDWEVPFKPIDYYRGSCLTPGTKLAVLSAGTIANQVTQAIAGMKLSDCVAHYDLGCIKPLDEELLQDVFQRFQVVITVEETPLINGVGAQVVRWANEKGYSNRIRCLGVPDAFVSHGKVETLLRELGLDATGLRSQFEQILASIDK